MLDCDPEFLTGCVCEGECTARRGCSCFREQEHQTGGAAYDNKGLLKAAPGAPNPFLRARSVWTSASVRALHRVWRHD